MKISQNKKWRVIIPGLGLFFLLVLVVSCGPKKEVKYETVKVSGGEISATIPVSGYVAPDNRLEIKPPVAGRLESVLVQEGDRVKKGDIIGWLSSTDRSVLLDAARAKGVAELQHWQEIYRPAPIVAPIDGFIIKCRVDPGQTFNTSDVIMVMANRLIITAQADETDLSRIFMGQPAEIVVDAYPQEKVSGQVSHIAYDSKVVNNVIVYDVDVNINKTKKMPLFLRSGMSVSVNLVQKEKKNVLLLPLTAIKKRGKMTYVLVQSDGAIQSRRIETGLEDSQNVELVSGLQPGDEVIIPTKELSEKYFNQNNRHVPPNPFSNKKTSN